MKGKKIEMKAVSQIEVKFDNSKLKDNVLGVIEREAKSFGNYCRVDCPLEYLERKVYLVIAN